MARFRVPLFLILGLFVCHLCYCEQVKKQATAVIVGTVFCDTCFNGDFSESSHFIQGASVAVECRDRTVKKTFTKEVKTNQHGQFEVKLPFSVSHHIKRIKRCSVKLVSSSEPYCGVASMAESSSLHLKSKRAGLHIYSAGFFTFKPLKQPDLCNQKPNPNTKIDPQFGPKKTYISPWINLPPLPALPQLPPLPALPSLPPMPNLGPPLPRQPSLPNLTPPLPNLAPPLPNLDPITKTPTLPDPSAPIPKDQSLPNLAPIPKPPNSDPQSTEKTEKPVNPSFFFLYPPFLPSPPSIPLLPSPPSIPLLPSPPSIPLLPSPPSIPLLPSPPSIPLLPSPPSIPFLPSPPAFSFPPIPFFTPPPPPPLFSFPPLIPGIPPLPTLPPLPPLPPLPRIPGPPPAKKPAP
ncbi:hypothetical protein AMTRI_Chr10g226920 [Amborella trichopoda]